MDTTLHEECSEIGRKMMEDALLSKGAAPRLGAFYLGNWLTDVSQCVDPVAIATARVKVLPELKKLAKFLKDMLVNLEVRAESLEAFRDKLDSQLDEITDAMGVITEATSVVKKKVDGKLSINALNALESTFYVIGYKRFVHAVESPIVKRMEYKAYKSIFLSRFTQYFPHEHLDRYPSEPEDRGGYSGILADGTETPTGVGTGSTKLTPHLYQYLADDIKIAAGLLAEIDLEWAKTTFDPLGKPDYTDVEWNTGLAKLGHALHAIEDYFAHSNFIELAIHQWDKGDKYRPKESILTKYINGLVEGPLNFAKGLVEMAVSKKFPDIHIDTSWEIYQGRLRRFDGKGKPNGEAEENVVTGYFDHFDTLFSLRHVWEEFFANHGSSDSPAAWRALLHQTILTVHEKSLCEPALSKEAARKLAEEALKESFAKGSPDVRLAANDLLNLVDGEVREVFFNAIAKFSIRAPNQVISLYTALELLNSFVNELTQPLRWVERMLGFVPKVLEKLIPLNTEMLLRLAIDNQLGRSRIGCHSLLAKDYECEGPDRKWVKDTCKLSVELAKAVHWYVVYSLTRWSRKETFYFGRYFTGSSFIQNTVDRRPYIDWLELLECFLRNPNAKLPLSGTPWWQEIITGGDEQMAIMVKRASGLAPPQLWVLPEVSPHEHIRVNEGAVKLLIDEASKLRKARETFYNTDPIIAQARASAK